MTEVAARRTAAVLRRHGLPFALAALYAGAALIAYAALDAPYRAPLTAWRVLFDSIAPTMVVVWASGQILLHAHGRHGSLMTRAGWAALGRRMADADQLAGLAIAVLFFGPFLDVYAWWKAHIPAFHPFGPLDVAVAHLERALHGGVDPWRITHAVLGAPWLTWLVDRAYVLLWTPIVFGSLIAWTLAPHSQQRTRTITAYFLAWIVIGTIGAIALATAGPCFYAGVTGSDFYAELFTRLDAVDATHPLLARGYQDAMWQAYLSGAPHNPGISAMPSMHVAFPAILACSAWSVRRWLAVAYGVLTLIVLVGSVHLGWHYALDGYLSLALAPLVWWLAGRVAEWWGGVAGLRESW